MPACVEAFYSAMDKVLDSTMSASGRILHLGDPVHWLAKMKGRSHI